MKKNIQRWIGADYLIIFLLLFLSIHAAQAAPLTLKEKEIIQQVDKEQQNAVVLLKKLVNINSGTSHITGVKRVGEILRLQFKRLGMKTHWENEPQKMHKAPTLIAEKNGTGAKRILLIGHLDTVFPPASPFRSFKQQGDVATGPGVIDDKGGDIVILYALKALYAAHVFDEVNVTVILTGDEEESGKPVSISRKPLIEAAKHHDIALDFEPGAGTDMISIARRGVSHWHIITQGEEAHSSEIFRGGFGAIYELARILDAIRIQFSREKYASINPGIILGGTSFHFDKIHSQGQAAGKINVIAKTAMSTGDFRYLTIEQRESLKQRMTQIVSNHLLGTKAAIQFVDGIPPMPPTENNHQLFDQFNQVNIDLGHPPLKMLDPGYRGAGDISYAAQFISAGLVGLGPVGGGAHTADESIALKTLTLATTRTAIFIYRLSLLPKLTEKNHGS